MRATDSTSWRFRALRVDTAFKARRQKRIGAAGYPVKRDTSAVQAGRILTKKALQDLKTPKRPKIADAEAGT